MITEAELRPYFLYLQHVKQYSRSASTIALCGITCFFEYTLHRDWTPLSVVRAPREKKLPVILSLEEVRKMLGSVRLLGYRVCLSTISSCGLRLQEGTHLLEAGVNLRLMQAYLGHRSPTPTSVYTHLTARAEHLGADAINRLMGDL